MNSSVVIFKGERNIVVRSVVPIDKILDEISPDEIIAFYNNKMYQLLDRIGKDKCIEYFNLNNKE